jgi:hypothetical protein
MAITINGSGTITGASTLATTVASPTFTTPNIDSAQFATVSGTAPIYPCRAWVNFNGTGTVAIRASGNVSSITDNGTGDYTVNFTTAMSDANYAIAGFGGSAAGDNRVLVGQGLSQTSAAGSCRIATSNSTNATLTDYDRVYISIFR